VAILGKIVDGAMQLNRFGNFVNKYWLEIPGHFLNVEIDMFVVMPNHFHSILVIHDCGGTACRAPTEQLFGRPTPNSLPTIIQYILDKPVKWDLDEENPNIQRGKLNCANMVEAQNFVLLPQRRHSCPTK
jgi:hypothetical protein